MVKRDTSSKKVTQTDNNMGYYMKGGERTERK